MYNKILNSRYDNVGLIWKTKRFYQLVLLFEFEWMEIYDCSEMPSVQVGKQYMYHYYHQIIITYEIYSRVYKFISVER